MNTRKLSSSAILIFLLGLQTLVAQLPDDFPSVSTFKYGETGAGKVFLSVSADVEGTGYYVFTLDDEGNIDQYRELDGDYAYDFKMQASGLLSYAQFIEHHSYTGGGNVYHVLMDQEMNELETYQLKNGYVAEAHDFQVLPNGHVLMFGYYLTQMDLSGIVEGGYPDAKVSGGIIQELDAEGNVVFQWRTWDHYTPEEYSWRRADRQTVSAFHLNTINMDIDGNIIFASPSFTKKLNRQTGEIIWHLGGAENEFDFIGVDSTEGVGQVTGHAFYRLENGNFLIYDNAGRQGPNTNSEAHEYFIDEENKTAELVWTYSYPTDIGAWHRGNAYRLPNGNTIIGWGGASGDPIPTCTEVDAEGNIVFEAYFDNPEMESYRAFRFPMGDWKIAEALVTELALGNTYYFFQGDTLDTGIEVEVTSMTGSGYNELEVATYAQAPRFPAFQGKDPRLLAQRVTMRPDYMILGGKAFFDVGILGISNPEDITVYFRETAGEGEFIPLTTSYNFVTGNIIAVFEFTEIQQGEFVFGYDDVESIAYAPVPVHPENEAEVFQEETQRLEWSPKGFFIFFDLEIATDVEFNNIVVEEDGLLDTFYEFDPENNTSYYWRVKTYTEDYEGLQESEWSETFVFHATAAQISVSEPAAEVKWQYGLDYFIQWDDNFADDVMIELLSDTSQVVLDTTASDGAYKWSIPVDQPIGCRYRIRITSIANPEVSGLSPYYFSVTDTTGNDGCTESITENNLFESVKVYPVPVRESLKIEYRLNEGTSLSIDLLNIYGQKVSGIYSGTDDRGRHSKEFAIETLENGIYILRLQTPTSTYQRKILLNK